MSEHPDLKHQFEDYERPMEPPEPQEPKEDKSKGYLLAAKAKVLENAVVYARLKIFGTFIDDTGGVQKFSTLKEEQGQVEWAREQLLLRAEALLHEMSLQADGTTPPGEGETT